MFLLCYRQAYFTPEEGSCNTSETAIELDYIYSVILKVLILFIFCLFYYSKRNFICKLSNSKHCSLPIFLKAPNILMVLDIDQRRSLAVIATNLTGSLAKLTCLMMQDDRRWLGVLVMYATRRDLLELSKSITVYVYDRHKNRLFGSCACQDDNSKCTKHLKHFKKCFVVC